MDVSEPLLVALMFITILTLGIANILSSIASRLDEPGATRETSFDLLHTSWVLIMLLAHLNFFWHTLDLLSKEDWDFEGFLFAITGPTLMFFATQVVIGSSPLPEGMALRDHYFNAARRFFALFAMVQVWVMLADVVLGRGLAGAMVMNLITLLVAVTLMLSRSVRVHGAGTVCAWVIYLAASVLRGTEVIT